MATNKEDWVQSTIRWFVAHRRQMAQCVVLVLVGFWFLPVSLVSLAVFFLLKRLFPLQSVWVVIVGFFILALTLLYLYTVYGLDLELDLDFFSTLAYVSRWKNYFLQFVFGTQMYDGFGPAFDFLYYKYLLPFVLALSLPISGVLMLLESIPNSNHEKALLALRRRKGVSGQRGEGKQTLALVRLWDGVFDRFHDVLYSLRRFFSFRSFRSFRSSHASPVSHSTHGTRSVEQNPAERNPLGKSSAQSEKDRSLRSSRSVPPSSLASSGSSSSSSSSFSSSSPLPLRRLSRLDRALEALDERLIDGMVLGLSSLTERPVVVRDEAVNQMVLVLGTTGGGKTITLRRFYYRAILAGYPLIIVDGKPTDENIESVRALSESVGKPFYGFNCGAFDHYDCLAEGGYTELKDKIISLKDEWESDYYRSIAEDYLQTTFEVLIRCRDRANGTNGTNETNQAKETNQENETDQGEKHNHAFDLKTVVDCLDYETLAMKVRCIDDERLVSRVRRLEGYDRKDIRGLQAHLNLLVHSELGEYFERCPLSHSNKATSNKAISNEARMFSLTDVIQSKGVVYFALPALRFPGFSKVLGKLVVNDIKAVIDRLNSTVPIFTVFDEFSVFAGEQVLNLVNMGRGRGVHAIFGTQGLSDLKKVDDTFSDQVLNCVNTVICHRLNDQTSAESISEWIGTRDSFDLTAQIDSDQGSTGVGSVRRNKEFIVHPDEIKQGLKTGEAFYITKVGGFKSDRIKVKYS